MLSKHSSLKMCLRAILKAAASRLELDMNMDLKCYLFSENFQFSRPGRRRKEQKSRQKETTKPARKKKKEKEKATYIWTLSVWLPTASHSYLIPVALVCCNYLCCHLHFSNSQSGSRSLATRHCILEQWAKFGIWQTYLLH